MRLLRLIHLVFVQLGLLVQFAGQVFDSLVLGKDVLMAVALVQGTCLKDGVNVVGSQLFQLLLRVFDQTPGVKFLRRVVLRLLRIFIAL